MRFNNLWCCGCERVTMIQAGHDVCHRCMRRPQWEKVIFPCILMLIILVVMIWG